MFKLELDMQMDFGPFMKSNQPGIILSRTFEIPFPPSTGMRIRCEQISRGPDPDGYVLEDVTWDHDRQAFLATVGESSTGLPMSKILVLIEDMVNDGWRLGSCREPLAEVDPGAEDSEAQGEDSSVASQPEPSWEEMHRWPSQDPGSRPEDFNTVFKAFIHALAEAGNNWSAAYAMDKTQLFFSDKELSGQLTPAMRSWLRYKEEFEAMGLLEQNKWADEMMEKYPSLTDLVGLPGGDDTSCGKS